MTSDATRQTTSEPLMVLFTGPPGTGKSTLADHAADVLGAAVFGWDWAMAAPTGFSTVQDTIGRTSHLEHRRIGWSILWNLATRPRPSPSTRARSGASSGTVAERCSI